MANSTVEVKVPAIGGFKDVGVIEVLVKPGDAVAADASLVTLESDKATMDVPSPVAGTVVALRVKVGDRVGEGSAIVVLEVSERAAAAPTPPAPAPATPSASPTPQAAAAPPPPGSSTAGVSGTPASAPVPAAPPAPAPLAGAPAHASPYVRKLARELGVDVSRVTGTGPRGRVQATDVQAYVKHALAAPQAGGGAGLDLLPWPQVDFARFGPVEVKPLSRLRRIAGANLARNWVMIPHVTQLEDADITDLEAFRQKLNAEQPAGAPRVTLLAFAMKACAEALRRFPEFNASLDGDALVLKRYVHLGFAADTPNGLVVPVIRDADKKGVLELAAELAALAKKARDGKLLPAEMQGGSFTISSLGGIGGTAFTPIINAPEVAILGLSRSAMKPVWDGKAFQPRLVLPLSLSYDHRVIDGAAGARFVTALAALLGDLRRALL